MPLKKTSRFKKRINGMRALDGIPLAIDLIKFIKHPKLVKEELLIGSLPDYKQE